MNIAKELDEFRNELKLALEPFKEKYNVSIQLGTFRYDDIEFKTTLTVKNIETENGVSIEQVEFEKYAKLYGLEKSDYMREVILQGNKFYLYGFKPKSPKNNCLIKTFDNDKYVVNIDVIKIKWKYMTSNLTKQ